MSSPPSHKGWRSRVRTLPGKRWPVAATIVLLAIANVSQSYASTWGGWLIVATNLLFLMLIAWLSRLTISQLGLSRRYLLRGLIWAAGMVLVIVPTMLIVFHIDRTVFLDSRYANTVRHAVYIALVTVPLHTVLVEEFAFRGVLWAAIKRWKGTGYATAISSLLFGLWHILPSLGLCETSAQITSNNMHLSNEAIKILPVVGSVVVTALTGVILCELRRRSRSLAAPIVAHWAINGCAVILSALV